MSTPSLDFTMRGARTVDEYIEKYPEWATALRQLRQWRFLSAKAIEPARVKAYVREAIDNQKQGREVAPDRTRPVVVPPELSAALARRAKANTAFAALTKGKQREYANYVAEAGRAETKAVRLARILPMIEAGVGLNDKYRGS